MASKFSQGPPHQLPMIFPTWFRRANKQELRRPYPKEFDQLLDEISYEIILSLRYERERRGGGVEDLDDTTTDRYALSNSPLTSTLCHTKSDVCMVCERENGVCTRMRPVRVPTSLSKFENEKETPYFVLSQLLPVRVEGGTRRYLRYTLGSR
jgi:hypothetical protein